MNKRYKKTILSLASVMACSAQLCFAAASDSKGQASQPSSQHLKLGVVNFKKCVEQSKVGKQEQATFENMKNQMESVLTEKEKVLNEMATKFNDPDYLDSLSPEAETDLKRKFRALNQELATQQQQFMQTLQQNNFKVVQKLTEMVGKASDKIAKKEKFDLIFNEEASFFYAPAIDLSDKIIAMMDDDFEKQAKEHKPALTAEQAGK